jgi:hypothetical protein
MRDSSVTCMATLSGRQIFILCAEKFNFVRV